MFELLCFLKHNTAYEMRISDCSSDVCSSDLSGINALQQLTMISLVVDPNAPDPSTAVGGAGRHPTYSRMIAGDGKWFTSGALGPRFEAMFMEVIGLGSIVEDERLGGRSEEHTSELQSLMRISYAVFCLKKKKTQLI